MKDLVQVLMAVCLGSLVCQAAAQPNAWTSPTSGNWQDASWSLGAVPGTNQDILLTNSGWKAVQIGSATAQNFPQSLNVDSVVISSPTNSFNTLLLNFAGAANPLTVKTFSVASNSGVTMTSSGLRINGPPGEGMVVGGTFDQSDSVVAGNQINVGYIGPGVYNFNGGYLSISDFWLGGAPGGVLNQNGGTNAFGTTHLEGGGEYVLSNGFFGGTISFTGGQFRQESGVSDQDIAVFQGNYLLHNGTHQGDATIPSTDGFSSGSGGMTQGGGTNYGSLSIGFFGLGLYSLTNGVSLAGRIDVGYQGSYSQSGGTQFITNSVSLSEQQISQFAYQSGVFDLSGGWVSSTGMSVQGIYSQSGGTNLIAGDLATGGAESSLYLSGGLLAANTMTVNPGLAGGIFVTGGTLVVSNELSVGGNGMPEWQGFLGGGRLIVSDIFVAPQGIFSCRDAVISQSGTLTLADASLYAGSNSVSFGRFCLGGSGNANSTLNLLPGSTLVAFANSSTVTWSNNVALVIENWDGSLFGGGKQQITFGNSASGLTTNQLAQIQFNNPAGLAVGTYPAKILPTGEIVPSLAGLLRANLALKAQSNGMQVNLQGETGRTYTIEISTDLVHWVTWTNQVATDGTIHLTDTQTANAPIRFYRAKLEP